MQQLLLDTVAHLPELEILRFRTPQSMEAPEGPELANFEPNPELQYVEELEIVYFDGLDFESFVEPLEDFQLWYMLEKDARGRPVAYREI
jgi:hypothetical protein